MVVGTNRRHRLPPSSRAPPSPSLSFGCLSNTRCLSNTEAYHFKQLRSFDYLTCNDSGVSARAGSLPFRHLSPPSSSSCRQWILLTSHTAGRPAPPPPPLAPPALPACSRGASPFPRKFVNRRNAASKAMWACTPVKADPFARALFTYNGNVVAIDLVGSRWP